MARVMKSFDTEEEYQAWVDGPYMRTPYTCFVRNTGAVHYEDGKDDDYSITLVARKTGWFRLFLPSWSYEWTDMQVYLNGELVNYEDCFTNAGHYYSKERIKELVEKGEEVDDHSYRSTMKKVDDVLDRGASEKIFIDNGQGWGYNWPMHIDSESGPTTKIWGPEKHMLGLNYENGKKHRKFIFVHKGDVVKMVFGSVNQYDIETDQYDNNTVQMNILQAPANSFTRSSVISWDWAKEIVIGDGFRNISAFRPNKARKIFFGKNVDYSTTTIEHIGIKDARYGKKNRSRVFCRKDTYNGDLDELDEYYNTKIVFKI